MHSTKTHAWHDFNRRCGACPIAESGGERPKDANRTLSTVLKTKSGLRVDFFLLGID